METDGNHTICECSEFGAIAVVREMSEPFEVFDKCDLEAIVKYVGLGLTFILLILFVVLVISKKSINDMFHSVRIHVCLTWMCAMVCHILSDLESIRKGEHSNLYISLLMIYFYTSWTTWVACEAHAIFKALTGGIISGRAKVYLPFGYGTPFSIIGVLFILYADELGTDPRCFLAWDTRTKELYFYYMFVLSIICIVIALIVLFNLARPQTKRKSVVQDLVSQGKGTILVCFVTFIFWILAFVAYIRTAESELPSIYCEFLLVLGWMGPVLFLGYGLMSSRFRNGMKKNKYALQEDSKSLVESESSLPTVSSTQSRPSTRVSMVKDTDSDDKELILDEPEPELPPPADPTEEVEVELKDDDAVVEAEPAAISAEENVIPDE